MTSSQRHLTISKLIAGGKSTAAPKNASLIGQLTVIDKNQSEFPRGTLLFSDKTGSIQCQLCKPLKRHWLKRDICLISWNYIHELFLPNLEIISEPLIVIKEDTQLENIKSNIYLYRPMMEGRNFMCTDDEVYAQYSPLTVKQVSLLITNKEKLQDPINLEGIILAKSILFCQSHEPAFFFLSLIDKHDGDISLHIIFRGDEFIDLHHTIEIGKLYIITNLEFIILPINSSERRTVLEFNRKSMLLPMHSTIHNERLEILTYRGIVTRILDNGMGILELDDELILNCSRNRMYNSFLPYRVGTKLILHNIHVISMKRNATFYKETYNLPYQPSLLLASCVYSTIHVKEFASVKEQKISSESNSPFSKFSSFREHEGFKISNLEWIQKVFKQIKSIYPIGDRVLQSHLLKLFERSGQTLIKSPIELDFFQHPLRCSRCVASETDIVSLTLSEALRIMQEEASSLFEPSGGKEDIKVIPKKDSKLSGATLIGILSGDFNGKLVIMDRGQQILVTESSGLIQTYHLGHIWLISDFELVYKREVSKACPSYKCQIRISLEKCVCIYLNLQPVKPPQYIIQIRRIDHRDRFLEVKALVLQFAQNRDPLAEESKRVDAFKYSSTKQQLKARVYFSQKLMFYLPALHVGTFYGINFGTENLVSPSKHNITLYLVSFNVPDKAQILKDLRELSFGPTVLQADQSLIEDWQSMNSEFQKKSLICQSSMDVLGKKDKNLGILKTRAETLYLFEYYHQRVPLEKVFRVFCKIGYVYKAILRYDCRKCERALSSHHSFQPCFGASSPTLYTYLKCRVNDGTYQAIAIFKDSNVFKALEIDNDLQKILRSEAKSRDFVYSSSSNIVVTDFDRCCVNLTKGFRNVVLFCRRSSSDEEELPSDAPISEYSRIQVGPRTSHYWTLMANNLFLEVVDIERLSVTGEAWSLVRNLEDDG